MHDGNIIGAESLWLTAIYKISHILMHAMVHLLDAVVWAVAVTTTLHGARPTHARKEATYNNISRTLLTTSFTRGVLGGGASDAAAPGGRVQGAAKWTAK
jgi:hypothetical protein